MKRFNLSYLIVFAVMLFLLVFFLWYGPNRIIGPGKSFIKRALYSKSLSKEDSSRFTWPEGKFCAISLTFDDARYSQVDKGIPLLNKYNVRGTFYVTPHNVEGRLTEWRDALKYGHEIGNHTVSHPCSGNHYWSQENALEDYTLERMVAELDSANKYIKGALGIDPVSFAYPCGNTFVGRGEATRSYIPLIAEKFVTGRGYPGLTQNDPSFCDLAQLAGIELDGYSYLQIKKLIKSARANGTWLVLVGHEMDDWSDETSFLSVLEAICKYATKVENGIWIDNVHNIASYIKNNRSGFENSALSSSKTDK